MTDTAASTPAADPGGAAPSAPAADSAPAAPAPPATPPAEAPVAEPDVFAETPDQAVFDRGYVERIRAEGAKYRTQARDLQSQVDPYQAHIDALASSTEADRGAWLELMNRMQTDRAGAADLFEQIATGIREEAGILSQEPPPAEPVEPPVPIEQMSPEQMQEFIKTELDKHAAETDQRARVDAIFKQIEEAGYDPDSPHTQSILWFANKKTNGDIPSAIKMYESDVLQGAVDDYIDGKTKAPAAPTAPDGGAAATGQPEPIKTLDQARDRTRAWIDQQRTPGGV